MHIFQILGLIFAVLWLWIIYEWWRAPLVEELPNGDKKLIRPAKKLSDLFKKKK
jgi:hypothetical protein